MNMTKEMLIYKLKTAKLRTVKAKMIVEAMNTGSSTRGNHAIQAMCSEPGSYVITMFYRGTPIVNLLMVADSQWTISDIGAGEYENTPATMRQRKDFAAAVLELQREVNK